MSAETETTYEFAWDAAKTLANVKKHGVTFEQAATVFLDALALTVYDAQDSREEDRWFTLGYDAGGTLLAVAHTYDEIVPHRVRSRVITARRATRRERRIYEDEPRLGETMAPDLIRDDDDMPSDIDFSGGTRGKFHRPNVKLQLPVYLDADVQASLAAIASKKGMGLSQLANELLKKEIASLDAAK